MIVLVCGGRDYDDAARVQVELDRLNAQGDGITTIVHGACGCDEYDILLRVDRMRGADRLAHLWAQRRGIPRIIAVPAAWQRLGPKAGPIRNARMLREHTPAVVVAFPGGDGTKDMLRKARAAGVEVIEVKEGDRHV